jgi:signal transduction histidine kinase
MEELVGVVQELSLARHLDEVTATVRAAARRLIGADGATFVLREGEFCFYADEDAIAPLWKGRRFPIEQCISGWSMLNRQSVVIEDIYQDSRIPTEAYRPTFVRSLVMVPIRRQDPIGAIGTYWAHRRQASEEEVRIIQALADSTSVAMENVSIYSELEHRVKLRTAELERLNRELESFSSSVAHDLRTPLGLIEGYMSLLLENFADGLPEHVLRCLRAIPDATQRMRVMVEGLLALARVGAGELHMSVVDISALGTAVVEDLRRRDGGRAVEIEIQAGLRAEADERLLRSALDNLIGNAWKYTGKVSRPRIEIGRLSNEDAPTFFVRDNGAGFDQADHDKLFVAFGRLHANEQFPGIGIGLATVRRIIERHGGRVWGEGEPGKGATFYFTLP